MDLVSDFLKITIDPYTLCSGTVTKCNYSQNSNFAHTFISAQKWLKALILLGLLAFYQLFAITFPLCNMTNQLHFLHQLQRFVAYFRPILAVLHCPMPLFCVPLLRLACSNCILGYQLKLPPQHC